MIEWWGSLPVELKFFYGIGIISMVVVVIQLMLTLVGFDGGGVDSGFDVELGDMDHGSGIGLFSVQTISAFFVAFGWVGVAAAKSGIEMIWVGVIAFGSGVLSMLLMFYMLKRLLGLQSKGNLDYRNAIGEVATVYVTIPGSDKDGGQVQVNLQDRFITANARKLEPGDLKAGQRVRIVAMHGPTDFVVEELTASAGASVDETRS